MIQLDAILDTTFVVKGLGLAGIPQPTDVNRAVFVSEASLDTALAAVVPAKDRPYLTMNDKVYAARHTIGVLTPLPASAPTRREVEDKEEEPEHKHKKHSDK